MVSTRYRGSKRRGAGEHFLPFTLIFLRLEMICIPPQTKGLLLFFSHCILFFTFHSDFLLPYVFRTCSLLWWQQRKA